MPEFRLHCFAQSGNAYKVALMLEMARADWEPVWVDFFAGETRTPGFRALNEMGEVPVLEHKGEVVSQSGAILDYLAAVLDEFDPGPENAREALRWTLWECQKLSGMLGPWRFMTTFLSEDKRRQDVIDFLEGRARGALSVLDRHLEGREWVAADWMTTADFACAGYLFYPDEYPIDWAAEYPNVVGWRERIRALEGWQHAYDLMPGHPFESRGAGRSE